MTGQQRYYAIVTWRKTGLLRFLGHLDVARTIDRAVRRAALPVVYSQGFSPTAHISFASALPVGVAGERELCAIELAERLPADLVKRSLQEQLPPDLGIVDVDVVARPGRKVFVGLTRAEYSVELRPRVCTLAMLENAVERVRNARELIVVRRTKSKTRRVDIRPGIHSLTVIPPGDDSLDGPRLMMALALDSERLVKPAEVLQCIADGIEDAACADALLQPRRITRLGAC